MVRLEHLVEAAVVQEQELFMKDEKEYAEWIRWVSTIISWTAYVVIVYCFWVIWTAGNQSLKPDLNSKDFDL